MVRKKNNVTLQRMLYEFDGEIIDVLCVVDNITKEGEFTLCGNAIPDNRLETFGIQSVGEEFMGKVKDVTCPNCRKIIDYIKGLK